MMVRDLVVFTFLGCFLLSGCAFKGSISCADVLTPPKKERFQKWKNSRISQWEVRQTSSPNFAISSPFEEIPIVASKGIKDQNSVKQIGLSAPPVTKIIDSRFLQNEPVSTSPEDLKDLIRSLGSTSDTTAISQFDENFLKAKKLAKISFWTSIIAVIGTAVPFIFLPMLIVSVVTGVRSLKKYRKSLVKKGRGFAIAGLWINSIWLAFLLIAVIFILLYFANIGFE